MAQLVEVFNKDAGTASLNPDSAYGGQTTAGIGLDIGKGETTYYARTYAYVDFSELPDGATVDSATINILVIAKGGDFTIIWKRMPTDWVEATITWNTQPTTETTPVSAVVTAATGWLAFECKALIEDAVTNHSKILNIVGVHNSYVGDADHNIILATREAGVESWRPYIEINYTVAGVAFTAKVMMF